VSQADGALLVLQNPHRTERKGKGVTVIIDALVAAQLRLLSVTDPVGNVTSFGYDALGRKISTSNLAIQANPLTRQTYEPDGPLATLVIARGNTVADTTSYAYDGFDRLSTTTYPDSSTEVLTYDADANVLTGKTRAGATLAFAYDTLNRRCTKTISATAPELSPEPVED